MALFYFIVLTSEAVTVGWLTLRSPYGTYLQNLVHS